jgi:hypothetical protein
MPAAGAMPMHLLSPVRYQLQRVETKSFGPFYLGQFVYDNSHAVTGRRACLTVTPALVIINVTPPPE